MLDSDSDFGVKNLDKKSNITFSIYSLSSANCTFIEAKIGPFIFAPAVVHNSSLNKSNGAQESFQESKTFDKETVTKCIDFTCTRRFLSFLQLWLSLPLSR